jgi:hypothetical protein
MFNPVGGVPQVCVDYFKGLFVLHLSVIDLYDSHLNLNGFRVVY